jgi:4-hydroxyphenylpyruvate dioxygenase-like putative hemolysin
MSNVLFQTCLNFSKKKNIEVKKKTGKVEQRIITSQSVQLYKVNINCKSLSNSLIEGGIND